MLGWSKIPYLRKDLQLSPMLLGGQSFRWKSPSPDEYIGVFKGKVWFLKQSDEFIEFKCHGNRSKDDGKRDQNELKNYLRLEVDLGFLYSKWSSADSHFQEFSQKFYGIRMLNQDITENIFSFICSSNNNIARISSMVEKLCIAYGQPIATLNNVTYYTFPEISTLTGDTIEQELRKAGFGYRAKFIYQAACQISEYGIKDWLKNVTSLPYPEAKIELMKLYGIGAKVADCICLMSLNHLEAIPVDTHVYQIASKRYLPHLRDKKSVTEKIYNEIGDHFRMLFGDYAGWAHTVLFCADLKSFQDKPTAKKRRKNSS